MLADKKTNSFVYFAVFSLLIALSVFAIRTWGYMPHILALWMMIAGLAGKRINRQQARNFLSYNKRILALAGIALLYMALSFLWSQSPSLSIERFLKIFLLSASGLILIYNLPNAKHKPPKLIFVLIGFLTACIFMWIEIKTDMYIFRAILDRENVPLSKLNHAAVVIAVTLSPILLLFMKHTYKMGWPVVYLLAGYLIFHSDSQSAQLAYGAATVAGLTVFLLPKSGLAFFTCIIQSFILTAPLFYPALRALWPYEQTAHFRNAVLERLDIWTEFARLSLEKPFFGHGLGTSRKATLDLSDAAFLETSQVLHPHSTVLQIWYEIGAVGIVLLSIFLTCVLVQVAQLKDRYERALGASLITAMGAVSLVGFGAWQSWLLGLYMLTAITFLQVYRSRTYSHLN